MNASDFISPYISLTYQLNCKRRSTERLKVHAFKILTKLFKKSSLLISAQRKFLFSYLYSNNYIDFKFELNAHDFLETSLFCKNKVTRIGLSCDRQKCKYYEYAKKEKKKIHIYYARVVNNLYVSNLYVSEEFSVKNVLIEKKRESHGVYYT